VRQAAPPRSEAQGTLVQRGPLRIMVAARGNLKAADSVSLKSEVEGRTLILSLVPEGTHVKAGDVVCGLDATALVEKGIQQRIAVSSAEASFVKASQNFEIQASQNQSDIATAKQKLEFAQQDVKKYPSRDVSGAPYFGKRNVRTKRSPHSGPPSGTSTYSRYPMPTLIGSFPILSSWLTSALTGTVH